MSERNYTPEENYFMYRYVLDTQGRNMRALGSNDPNDDFGFLHLGLFNEDGSGGFYFYPQEYLEQFKQFRELSYYFGQIGDLWKVTNAHPRKRKAFLDKLEKDLETIHKYDYEEKSKNVPMLDKLPSSIDKMLLKWYLGDIYPEEFTQYVYDEIMGKDAKKGLFYSRY